MKAETVEVVRERERELFPSKISFINGAIKIKYMAKSKKGWTVMWEDKEKTYLTL